MRELRHLDLLNFCSQLLQCSVAVHSVRNVIPETVAQYALAVCLPDAVSLTDAAEGMAGRSGAFYYKILLDFYLKICIIAEKAGLFTEDDVANWITQSRREEATE